MSTTNPAAAATSTPLLSALTLPTPINQTRILEISLCAVAGLMLLVGAIACARVGAFRFRGVPIGASLIAFSTLPAGSALALYFTEPKVILKSSYTQDANWAEKYTVAAAFDHAISKDGEWTTDHNLTSSVLEHARKTLNLEKADTSISGTLTVHVNDQQIYTTAFSSLHNLLSELKPPEDLQFPFIIRYKFDCSPKIVSITQEITQDVQTHLKMTITVEN